MSLYNFIYWLKLFIQSSGMKLQMAPSNTVLITQSVLMTSLSHGTADWFPPVSVTNELAAQHKYITVAVAAYFRSPPPSPAPPVQACCKMIHVRYMWVISCMLYLEQQCFLLAHSSMLWMYWQQQQQRSRSILPRPNTLTL